MNEGPPILSKADPSPVHLCAGRTLISFLSMQHISRAIDLSFSSSGSAVKPMTIKTGKANFTSLLPVDLGYSGISLLSTI